MATVNGTGITLRNNGDSIVLGCGIKKIIARCINGNGTLVIMGQDENAGTNFYVATNSQSTIFTSPYEFINAFGYPNKITFETGTEGNSVVVYIEEVDPNINRKYNTDCANFLIGGYVDGN